MSTRRSVLSLMFGFLVLGLVSPAYAQEAAGGAANSALVQWSVITAGFALAIAAAGAALGQGRAVASAAEAIARNPGASGEIRKGAVVTDAPGYVSFAPEGGDSESGEWAEAKLGTIRHEGLAPGRYVVRWHPEEGEPGPAQVVTVAPGETTTVDVTPA